MLTSNVFEATRGCVHRCDFCVVPTEWGRKSFQKPVEEVVADIRQHGARKLIFVDLNLIAHRGNALELFAALIPLRPQWSGLATTLLPDDPELLELCGRSDCTGLLMGRESISETNLRANHKGCNAPAVSATSSRGRCPRAPIGEALFPRTRSGSRTGPARSLLSRLRPRLSAENLRASCLT